ncbi:abortive infection family protein [Sphingobium sp. AP49]|uniref:abortive infection family protein n=1 Tax=Sphingobium sp. AP49 TaxID=1144307 RepID=UPI00026EE4EF|nr:abortive infection family protein [Sphingobium sp. AP49]WHO37623.1 abortive infection family protein [Sphingobium sp. AP49]
MAYQLQLLRSLIERHPERAGNLELHVRALEQSIEQLPNTCLASVRTIFEAAQASIGLHLNIEFGRDGLPGRMTKVIEAFDFSMTDHPDGHKIHDELSALIKGIEETTTALARLSNIPNMRHGGALDWAVLQRQHAYMLGGLCDALVSFLLDVAWSRQFEEMEDLSGPSYALESDFNESLDNGYELVEIAGSSFEASRILFTLDPTQYEAALTEWRLTKPVDGEQEAAA